MTNSLSLLLLVIIRFFTLFDEALYIVIQESKFANIQFHEFDQSGQGPYIKFCVHFHPVGYVDLLESLILYLYFAL